MLHFLTLLLLFTSVFHGSLQGKIDFESRFGEESLLGDDEIASAADAKISDDMARLNFFRAEIGEIIMSELRVEGTNDIDPHAVGYVSGRIAFESATIAGRPTRVENSAPTAQHPLTGQHPTAAGGRADSDGAKAEPAGHRAGPCLPDPRNRLETGLPGSEIRIEIHSDFVVPLRAAP